MYSCKFLCLLLAVTSLTSLAALPPAGRNLPSARSTLNNADRGVDQGVRDNAARVNNYYNSPFPYPYSSPYGPSYYNSGYGYYPAPYPYEAFPDDAEADKLFENLSK